MITVLTAIYNKFDTLKLQPKQNIDCKYICVCDVKPDMEAWAEDQREIMYFDSFKHFTPAIKSKYVRTHPFMFTDNNVVWIDGSIQFTSDDIVELLSEWWKAYHRLSTVIHPERNSIKEEAQFCVSMNYKKYQWLPMLEQVEFYKNVWYKDDLRLSAVWLLYMKNDYSVVDMLDKRWVEILTRWPMDQLSFEPCRWLCKVTHKYLELNLWDNKHFKVLNHAQ